MGAERAVVVRPGEGHHVANVEFLARTADTPRFNVSIITKQPGEGPPLHVHPGEADAFYILEGDIVMIVEDEEIVVGPGTFVLVPPGVPHTFANRTRSVARIVNVPQFAYVVRNREDSLTSSEETGLRSTVRRDLSHIQRQRAAENAALVAAGKDPVLTPLAVAGPLPLTYIAGPALRSATGGTWPA